MVVKHTSVRRMAMKMRICWDMVVKTRFCEEGGGENTRS